MSRGVPRRNKRPSSPARYDETYQDLAKRTYEHIQAELTKALEGKKESGERAAKLLKALRDVKKIRDEALGGASKSAGAKDGEFDLSDLGASPRGQPD